MAALLFPFLFCGTELEGGTMALLHPESCWSTARKSPGQGFGEHGVPSPPLKALQFNL